MQKKINVLGVRFDNVTLAETIDFVADSVDKGLKGYICTPNPEMLLEAVKYDKFKVVLNQSLLNIPDGIGILWAATNVHNKSTKLRALSNLFLLPFFAGFFKKALRERVTGTDLLKNIAVKSSFKDYKVFLLGAATGIAAKCADKLKKTYPEINIVGTYSGSPAAKDKNNIVKLVNNAKPDILFVAFGAPNQELWIAETINKLKSVKIAIGVGGAFDFIAGKRKRAPKLMQKIGLEWLFRLFQEPKRIKRIINAIIVFPYRFIKSI